MQIIKHEEKKTYRLNKFISDQGFSSRRGADRLVEEGLVFVNGVKAVVGMQVSENDIVTIDGKELKVDKSRVYLMLNKPKGVISTTDSNIKGNIKDYVNYHELVFPIGRLDKDSTGLILLTNDGDIVNKILRVEYGHEKEYIVTVDKDIDNDFIDKMESGVEIYNPVQHRHEITMPAVLKQLSKRTFSIIIKQGLNRQIRRMTKALGFNVKELERIRIMDIKLGDLKVGDYRLLNKEELLLISERIKEDDWNWRKS